MKMWMVLAVANLGVVLVYGDRKYGLYSIQIIISMESPNKP